MAQDNQDYSITLTVDQTPEKVFNAINNVRGWWLGDNEGSTNKVNDEFIHQYENDHYCKIRVTELIPGQRIVWHVVENRFSFTKDQSEWTGTDIVFDIAKNGSTTDVHFTHRGLVPKLECYNLCSDAWAGLISGDLRKLITTT